MAEQGLRVLAFAHSPLEKEVNTLDGIKVNIVGLMCFQDTPKEIAKEVGIYKDGDIPIEAKIWANTPMVVSFTIF